MKEVEKEQKTKPQSKDPIDWINKNWAAILKIGLPATGGFAALLYLLGRLRTDAYYYHLGINPHALSFTSEDYMFLSFNLVLTFLMIPIIAIMAMQLTNHTKPINVVIILNCLIIPSILIIVLRYFLNWNIATEWIAILQGLVYGATLAFILLMYTERFTLDEYKLKLEAVRVRNFVIYEKHEISLKRIGVILIFLFSIVLFAITPSMARAMGEWEAKYDLNNRFPSALIYCDDKLPALLTSESLGETSMSKEVIIAIINNEITYVMDVIERENGLITKWSTFAVPDDRIIQIRYLTVEKTFSNKLEDTKWVLQSYGEQTNSKALLEGTEITATFNSSIIEVSGLAGCNNYNGNYKIDGGKLFILEMAYTEMACLSPEGVMDQEQEFLSILANAQSYEADDTTLTIFCSGGLQLYFTTATR